MEHNASIEQLRLERARKRVKALAGFYKHLSVYVLINAFLITMNYFRLSPSEPFLKFDNFATAFFWGIGLGFHALSVFGTNAFLGVDWEERKIRQIMDRDKRNKWE